MFVIPLDQLWLAYLYQWVLHTHLGNSMELWAIGAIKLVARSEQQNAKPWERRDQLFKSPGGANLELLKAEHLLRPAQTCSFFFLGRGPTVDSVDQQRSGHGAQAAQARTFSLSPKTSLNSWVQQRAILRIAQNGVVTVVWWRSVCLWFFWPLVVKARAIHFLNFLEILQIVFADVCWCLSLLLNAL